MHTWVRCVLIVATGVTAAACQPIDIPDPLSPEGPEDGLRVLFIGNSLTSTHDVPRLVRALAGADDEISIATLDVSRPNYALMDHWAMGSRDVVRHGRWDVVVLQQGPSSLDSSRENLIAWSGTWSDFISARGARSALYMVWPERQRLSAFDAVSASYRAAADSAGIGLLPAGEAWRRAWDVEPGLSLYGPDDFHPSRIGATLAAISIYRGLTGRLPLPDAAGALEIGAQTFDLLLDVAAAAHDQFGRTP